MTVTRCAVIDKIKGLLYTEKSGSYELIFHDGSFVNVQSSNIKQLANYFNCKNGGLQEKIRGLMIIYCMSFENKLLGLTPVIEWKGPEMNEGDFLIDHCICYEWS